MALSVLIREERIRNWDRWRAVLCQALGPARGMVAYELFLRAWDALQARGSKAQVLGIRLVLHWRGLEEGQARAIRDTVLWMVEQLKDEGILAWWRSWGGESTMTVALVFPTLEGTKKFVQVHPPSTLALRIVKAVDGRLRRTSTRIWEKVKEELPS